MSEAHGADRARTPDEVSASWKREAVELAVLFMTVGLAHLLAILLGHTDPGPMVLVGLGVAVIAGAFVHKRLSARRGRVRLPRETRDVAEDRPMSLWRIRTRVVDRPGRLADLAGAFAGLRCNVLALHIAATGGSAVSPSGCDALDEFVIEAPAGLSMRDLGAAVGGAGGLDTVIVRAHVEDLVDPGVQALVLAHRVSEDPDRLPEAMAKLLRAPAVHWRRPGDTVDGAGERGTTLVVSVHPERALLVSRPALPFTPTEAARAAALAASAKRRRYHSGGVPGRPAGE
ncbi:hypothetical protein GCM10023194_35840 [Planotetraspora phitsanulokensis]|uniref:ACT domain-containing protein n=1 Tax=Planotetraspora phitsanulokensis TaxID=575192 RepID=A0A8J3XH82_9ACTN|nr:hypothetical protein [Planotetraspora phitsanulokensis]GII36288.1 hypothetical protein Pph01_12910 [Planotetraspora phitsanulokensis]